MATQAPQEQPTLRCAGQCGATLPDDGKAVLSAGWSFLDITMRWRCGACERALRAVVGITGTDAVTVDTLPPDSIGALQHRGHGSTAGTIVPVAVKG